MKKGHIKRRIISYITKSVIVVCLIPMTINLSGCSLFADEEKLAAPTLVTPKKMEYKTVEACKGIITDQIGGYGKIVATNQTNVYFKLRGGYIKSMPFKVGDKVKKGDMLAEMDTDKISSDIKLQELEIKKAKLMYDKYNVPNGDPYEIKMAALDVEIEENKLAELKNELNKSILYSPIDGVITDSSDINIGEEVKPYELIYTIADPNSLAVDYNGDYVEKFSVGMPVTFTYYVDKDKKIVAGKVLKVSTEKDYSKGITPYVRMTFDKTPEVITIGATMDFSSVYREKRDVIVIPRTVIYSSGKEAFVQVLVNGEKIQRPIGVGLDNGTEVEVTKGLEEGDLIVLK